MDIAQIYVNQIQTQLDQLHAHYQDAEDQTSGFSPRIAVQAMQQRVEKLQEVFQHYYFPPVVAKACCEQCQIQESRVRILGRQFIELQEKVKNASLDNRQAIVDAQVIERLKDALTDKEAEIVRLRAHGESALTENNAAQETELGQLEAQLTAEQRKHKAIRLEMVGLHDQLEEMEALKKSYAKKNRAAEERVLAMEQAIAEKDRKLAGAAVQLEKVRMQIKVCLEDQQHLEDLRDTALRSVKVSRQAMRLLAGQGQVLKSLVSTQQQLEYRYRGMTAELSKCQAGAREAQNEMAAVNKRLELALNGTLDDPTSQIELDIAGLVERRDELAAKLDAEMQENASLNALNARQADTIQQQEHRISELVRLEPKYAELQREQEKLAIRFTEMRQAKEEHARQNEVLKQAVTKLDQELNQTIERKDAEIHALQMKSVAFDNQADEHSGHSNEPEKEKTPPEAIGDIFSQKERSSEQASGDEAQDELEGPVRQEEAPEEGEEAGYDFDEEKNEPSGASHNSVERVQSGENAQPGAEAPGESPPGDK